MRKSCRGVGAFGLIAGLGLVLVEPVAVTDALVGLSREMG